MHISNEARSYNPSAKFGEIGMCHVAKPDVLTRPRCQMNNAKTRPVAVFPSSLHNMRMIQDSSFHHRLIETLRALIIGRLFPPGTKFLTEREIASRYNTSRPTANKALNSLVSEGFLEFRRGTGTFVREAVLHYDLERLVSFTDKALAAGAKPATELIEFKKIRASSAAEQIARRLRCPNNEPLIYMERVRLASVQPVIYERRYVSARHCKPMTRKDASGSLYAFWTEKCELTITGAEEIIRAVNASREQADRLRIPAGAACFLISATGFVCGNVPLWYEETLYRADAYEFRNRLGGISPSGPVQGHMRDAENI